jgi:hypothetical protein
MPPWLGNRQFRASELATADFAAGERAHQPREEPLNEAQQAQGEADSERTKTPEKQGQNAREPQKPQEIRDAGAPPGGCRAVPPGRGTRLAPAAKSALRSTLSSPLASADGFAAEIQTPKGVAAGGRGGRQPVDRRPIGWGPREIHANEADWWQTVLDREWHDHPALVGTVEIARALGRKPQTIRKLRMLGKLPPPVIVAGRLRWWRLDIKTWMLSRGLNPSSLSTAKATDDLPTTEPTT